MYDSKKVVSNQPGVHERLVEYVKKHMACDYRKPCREHNREAFATFERELASRSPATLILDSCCGTGMSTRILAQRNPEAFVVGVDQSEHRLNKYSESEPENCLFLRANCEDVWRLFVQNNIVFDEHFILYPNPWPKSVQFKRRWQGHPVFPVLPELSKTITLRSNWQTYLDEFALAWQVLTGVEGSAEPIVVDDAMTLFEKKYAGSEQPLFELVLSKQL
ncbi:MAG: methyltransferase domain-containing protein [Agarilytica sp.]